MRVVIISNDWLGNSMAGPAIRCVELACVLAKRHEVLLLSDSKLGYKSPSDTVRLLPLDNSSVSHICDSANVIVIQGDILGRYPQLMLAKGALVADLYCPLQLEFYISSQQLDIDFRSQSARAVSQVLLKQLYISDHFICASLRQQHFWLGAYSLTGRLNGQDLVSPIEKSSDDLISIIPFGTPNPEPTKTQRYLRKKFNLPESAFVLVWGGGVYDWFDLTSLIYAVSELAFKHPDIHLVFLGVRHPNPNIAEHDSLRDAVNLSRKLDLFEKNIHFNFGWVDYHERDAYLCDADIGVSSHFDNLETTFSFRTRMLDYLWCGLPIVATKGDVFGDTLESRGVGLGVVPSSVESWVFAISRLKNDPALRKSCSLNAKSWASELKWENNILAFSVKCDTLKAGSNRKELVQYWIEREKGRKLSYLARAINLYRRNGLKGLLAKFITLVKRLSNQLRG